MERTLKIYIAGKVSGLPMEDVKAKFQEAEQTLFTRTNLQPVNPTKYVPEGTPWEDAMVMCIDMLRECTAIYVMSDWGESPGAKLEFAYARAHDYAIFHEASFKSINYKKPKVA